MGEDKLGCSHCPPNGYESRKAPSDRVMSRQDLLQRILVSLHETVLDDSHWPATSALIDEACGTKGNTLGLFDGNFPDDIDVFLAWCCFHGERRRDLERRYLEVYLHRDERIPPFLQLPDSQLAHVASLYTEEGLRTSLVYNEALPLFQACNSLNVRLDGPGGSHIVWVFADPTEAEGWSSTRIDTIKGLLPHVRQLVWIRQALVDANALNASLAVLLENTRAGVIQLDRRGRIVAANDRARDLLREGAGLADPDGFLEPSSPEDDAEFQELLARALPLFGGQGASGSMVVRRPHHPIPIVLHVIPVRGEQADSRPRRVAALVLVVDPASRRRIDPGLVGAMLGLTPAESHVAVLLAEGNTIRDIAMATGRSEGTIRWHVKSIFAKLGISRQLELAQLVLALSDIR